MRHVFPADEVYHLWANETQDQAYNSQRNVSFRDSGAYSYAAVIGRIVHSKKRGRAYLLTIRTWSVTTSKHQGMLRNAVPRGERVFNVSLLHERDTAETHKARIAAYVASIGSEALAAKRARLDYSKSSHLATVATLVQEVADYCAYFGIRAPKIKTETLAADLEKARKVEAKRQRDKEAARRQELQAMAQEWRDNERQDMPYDYPDVLLRALDGEVQTSRGARVHYNAAERLFRAWVAGNVAQGDRVGPYTVSRVNDGDSITIGCHVITRAEAERFATSQGWGDVTA